ncbi:MAG: hypothetical protein ABIK64_01160 [Bacillota bacterium]
MRRRLFIFFAVLFGALGVLLLLSSLIEGPAAEDTPETLPAAHTITAFAAMPPAPTSASAAPVGAWLRIAALFAAVAVSVPCLSCTCDANGRVLCKRRYARSYHLVFKQEFACG